MSQVYANSTNKYWSIPGLNQFTVVAIPPFDVLHNGDPPTQIPLNTVALEQSPGLMHIKPGGEITFDQPGIYCINYTIQFSSPSNPLSVSGYIEVDGLAAQTGQKLARFNTSSDNQRVFQTLNYTGFFNTNDSISAWVTNEKSPAVVNLEYTETVLNISRVV